MARFKLNRPSQSRYNAKRKRSSPASYASRRVTGMQRAIAAVVPGYTRSGGSYGRYGVSARRLGLEPEKKYFDTTLAFTFDATGEVPATGQLNLIPQGDTQSTRDGRSAVIESIQIRANIGYSPGAAANMRAITHLYLVLDTQCNGAAAAVGDVMIDSAGNPGTDLSVSMLNLYNSGRFRIIKHWTHVWGAQAGVTTAYNAQAKQLEYFKKVNIPITWSSTTGAITEIKSNNLFLLAGAALEFSGVSDDLVSVNGCCRLRFRG